MPMDLTELLCFLLCLFFLPNFLKTSDFEYFVCHMKIKDLSRLLKFMKQLYKITILFTIKSCGFFTVHLLFATGCWQHYLGS